MRLEKCRWPWWPRWNSSQRNHQLQRKTRSLRTHVFFLTSEGRLWFDSIIVFLFSRFLVLVQNISAQKLSTMPELRLSEVPEYLRSKALHKITLKNDDGQDEAMHFDAQVLKKEYSRRKPAWLWALAKLFEFVWSRYVYWGHRCVCYELLFSGNWWSACQKRRTVWVSHGHTDSWCQDVGICSSARWPNMFAWIVWLFEILFFCLSTGPARTFLGIEERTAHVLPKDRTVHGCGVTGPCAHSQVYGITHWCRCSV